MTEKELNAIKTLIQAEVARQIAEKDDTSNNFIVPNHIHNGLDSPLIPSKNIKGAILTAVPDVRYGKNGDILLADIGGTRYIYGKINDVWYRATIT